MLFVKVITLFSRLISMSVVPPERRSWKSYDKRRKNNIIKGFILRQITSVITGFVIWWFLSIQVTVILPGPKVTSLKRGLRYIRVRYIVLVISGFVISVFVISC